MKSSILLILFLAAISLAAVDQFTDFNRVRCSDIDASIAMYSPRFYGGAFQTENELLDGNIGAALSRNDYFGGDGRGVGVLEMSTGLPIAMYQHTDGGIDSYQYGAGKLHFDNLTADKATFDCAVAMQFVSINGVPLGLVTNINFVGAFSGTISNGQAVITILPATGGEERPLSSPRWSISPAYR